MTYPLEGAMAEYCFPFSRIEVRVGELARATRRLFTEKVSPNTIGTSFLASDPEHLRPRDAYHSSTFEARDSHHLVSAIVQGNEVVYEIKGLKLQGPHHKTIEATARAIGINSSLVYHYDADAFRVSETSGSDEWIPGKPPGFESLTLIRQGNRWSVEAPSDVLRR